MFDETPGDAVRQATDNSWFERLARAGYVVSGLLHLLIAYTMIRLAFGDGGTADQSGALGIFASSPGGRFALWIAVVALVAMALWRFAETLIGQHPADPAPHEDGGWFGRMQALSLAAVYVVFAWTAAQFALGHGRSSGRQNAGLSARLMSSTAGQAVLVLVGLVIIGVGVYHVHKGVSRSFLDDLKSADNHAVAVTGVIGYTAKGLVLGAVGVLVIAAALTADPAKATGLDGAVKTAAGWPAGQALLVVAALGLAAYGVYSFVMARHARM
ncbi:MAG: DUF1206 domain-containing protein [Gordonia sp. (in: high G+C Gram-positive bacteria)]